MTTNENNDDHKAWHLDSHHLDYVAWFGLRVVLLGSRSAAAAIPLIHVLLLHNESETSDDDSDDTQVMPRGDPFILRFRFSSWPEFPRPKLLRGVNLSRESRVIQIPERLTSYETNNKIINQNCFAHDKVT